MNWQDISISSDITPQLTDNAALVLEKRYQAKDNNGKTIETQSELFQRVAKTIASAEINYGKSKEEIDTIATTFYEMMAQLSFIPNSPTLMNAGRPLGQLSACFVLPVEDSMDKIFDAVKNMALIHKSGGGTGFSFSRLRPKNSSVQSTAGVSSGPVSFMRIFNTATETIKQGGTRRGANMAILNIDHPDIMEFITAKEDTTALTNFNISVAITDEFMKAVKNEEEYPLRDPNTGDIVAHLKARDVYDTITEKAWNTGEPGIVFIDRINDKNPIKKVGLVESTNPCVTKDTFVLTTEGPRRVADLIGKQFTAIVDGKKHDSGAEGFFSTGTKDIYTLKTKEGYSVKLTGDHPVLAATSLTRWSQKTEWIRAADLVAGDTIIINNHRTDISWSGEYSQDEGYLVGLLYGDGTIKKDKAVISIWPEKKAENGATTADAIMTRALECAQSLPHRSDFKGFSEVKGRGEYRIASASVRGICLELGIEPGSKKITPALEACSSDFTIGFLQGLFDADGSIQGTHETGISVRLAQSDIPTLKAVQRMLLRLGIASTLHENRRNAKEILLPDGRGGVKTYPTKAQHELIISKDNLYYFAEKIGFTHSTKSAKLNLHLKTYKRSMNRERFTAEFTGLTPAGTDEVYDVQVPGINAFDGNGVMLHNCGEQPLLPYESCNLGSINLNAVVKETDGTAEIDYELLKKLTRYSVRFLDDVIDINNYPLDSIREQTLANRKIGLGIMGFADLLIKTETPYDSDEAIEMAEKIMSTIQDESKKASHELALERGPFPNFEKSDYFDRGEKPLRNATTTTIAPTGTISILANSSGGIEPVFALAYIRNVMDNNKLIETNPIFRETMKAKGLYSEELMEKVADHGSVAHIDELSDDIKRTFVTSHDISPEWHIKIQGAFQKYVDNAVSKTVNFPNSATLEDIEQVYSMAYDLGCKGVTVYRDGSRDEQVLQIQSKKKEVKAEEPESTEPVRISPRPREEITWGTTRKMTTGCGNLYVTINEDEKGLFEVFATMGKSGGCAASQTEAVSRLISLGFRSGLEKDQIIKQIKGVRCPNQAWEKGGRIYSCADAIAKALERHTGTDASMTQSDFDRAKMNAETNGKGSDTVMVGVCPDCHGPLEFESGCSVCRSCGFSRCG